MPWTEAARREYRRACPRYASDLTDREWALVAPFMPRPRRLGQRLGRVEKQFGLPNSAAPAERISKASVEDVGWPLDLNKPKDRENVDKAVSFHDL